jgi:hypothetical protein
VAGRNLAPGLTRRFLASSSFDLESAMDWMFGVTAAALWAAVWGLAQGCARLDNQRDER